MAGGLIQLFSYGFEDKPLISNPQITFFKIVYYKYSLFSIEDQELSSESDINFGGSTYFKIRNNGDLFYKPILKIELPSVRVDYTKTIDEYLTEYNNEIKNSDINLIISKLSAILFNYNTTKFPIYIKNNLIINTYYDSINYATNEKIIYLQYDNSYNNIFNFDSSVNNFQKNLDYLVLNGNISTALSRNIYYSTFNINYLTTILNNKNYSNNIIYTKTDYFNNFTNTLLNFIMSNDEIKFIYSLIKDSQIDDNFSNKNITQNITTQIQYKLNYFYSNINILYIYTNNTNSKILKGISFVNNYNYSEYTYVNNIIPFTNLYTEFENDISNGNSSDYFISSLYALNKNLNITSILRLNVVENSYDISLNNSLLDLSNNLIYFIYKQNNFLNLYTNNYIIPYNNQIYNNDLLLLPICIVVYNSTTGFFDKISLSKTIDQSDYIFMYKDIFIFNKLSQKNEFILINDKMYQIYDTSNNNTLKYSDSIFIDISSYNINNQLVYINNNISYILSSTTKSLSFIDANNENNTFNTFEFIPPYQIFYIINNDNFNNNRLKQINSVNYQTLNLDIYNNFIFNKTNFQNSNLSSNLKNSLIINNINKTLIENITYITNLFKYFLNNSIYFKQWNRFQVTSLGLTNIILNIDTNFTNNYYSNIFSTLNINGTNNFYNNIQDIIVTNINIFFDNYEIYFNNFIRYIYNLKNTYSTIPNTFNMTRDTEIIYILSNCSNIQSYITIKNILSDAKMYELSNNIKMSSIYFKINTSFTDIISDLSNNFGYSIQNINGYYCIKNIIYNSITLSSNNININLLPYDIASAKQFYLLMYLLNYPLINNSYIITNFYLMPYNSDILDYSSTLSSYAINLNQISYIYDSIYSNNIPITSNNSNHYFSAYFTSQPLSLSTYIDAANILYHYSYNLYISIKDIIGPKNISNSNFATFVDMKTYENLWYLMQNISKNVINGNIYTGSTITTAISYFNIDCNINFSTIVDNEIINNSLVQIIDTYLESYIKPLIINLLSNNTDFYNLYNSSQNFIFTKNINQNSLDINIINLSFIKLFYWYLHYLNSIISIQNNYLINYNSDLIFSCTLNNFNEIKFFFDSSTDSSYNSIVLINNKFYEVINYITILLNNQQIVNNNSINVYTTNNFATKNNTIFFNKLSLDELIYNLPTYYCNNFYINYQYKTLVDFFYNVKNSYITQYDNIISKILNSNLFSSNLCSSLIQYNNFYINNYFKLLSNYQLNKNYNSTNDMLPSVTLNQPIDFNTFYSFSFDVTNINKFYNLTLNEYTENYNIFYNYFKILDILYLNVDKIINNFNKFFNYNYIFNSDFHIIYCFYFYIYNSYTFNYNNTNYVLYFDTNNISTNNYILNTINNKIYNYLPICFINSSNIVVYKVINNNILDLSNNNVYYDYNNNNSIDYVYSYSNTNYLIIINNNIYDSSLNLLYIIINNIIYNNNTVIGNINGNIYDISNNKYKYLIDNQKRQILYSNYTQIFSDKLGNFLINNTICKPVKNIFYDNSTNLLNFYFQEPNISNASLHFHLTDIYNFTITIYPSQIRSIHITKEYQSTNLNLSTVFSSVFNSTNNAQTITYLNNDIKNNFINLNPKLLVQLLNNCIKNSIFSSQYLNNDIFISSSFNNYLNDNNLNSTNLQIINNISQWLVTNSISKIESSFSISSIRLYNIVTWLNNYNKNSINQIKIFNQTDQTIHNIVDFITSGLNGKIFYFVPEYFDYYPINSNGQIVQPDNLIDRFNYNNTSHFNYMLTISKDISINSISYLENLNVISKLIKNKIINTLINDISNQNIINSYYTYSFFNINNNIVTIETDNSQQNNNSYFIINSNIISLAEKNLIYNIGSNNNYTVSYINYKFYLLDLSSNINYLITTNTENINNYQWDISDNSNYYYKFNSSLNSVLINITNSLFPSTLFIFNGLINRINRTSFGYKIDSSANLIYNFSYDLSFNILSRALTKFNYGIFEDYKNSNNYIYQEIPIILCNYQDLSNNYLTNINNKILWDSSDILVQNNDLYIVIQNYKSILKTPLEKEYIIINNSSSNTIFNVVTNIEISGNYILKVQSIDSNFMLSLGTTYKLQIGIGYFINILGTESMNDNCVFYYWETFNSTINNIVTFLNNSGDSYFNQQKFTLAQYIDEIYIKITEISNESTNFLFEIPECIFNKKSNNILNIFNDEQAISSSLLYKYSSYTSLQKIKLNITNQIKRPSIPTCSWVSYIGHFLIDKITFKIDDNIIEEIDDQIMHIYNFLNANEQKEKLLNKMIGNTPDLTYPYQIINKKTLYVPLPFFFENHEKALPIISLLYSKLTTYLTIKNIEDVLITPIDTNITKLTKLKIKLCGTYVFLDNDEKLKFAQMRHEYLIKTKKNIKYYINNNNGSFKLDLYLPTCEIFWFYINNNILKSKNYWNYTGINYKEYYSDDIFSNIYNNNDDVTNFINNLTKNTINKINWYRKNAGLSTLDLQNNLFILNTDEIKSLKEYLYYRSKNKNPFISSSLEFNGNMRFKVDGQMANSIIPIAYYNQIFPAGLNVYTFSRYPKEITHSGALNFKYAKNIYFKYLIDIGDNNPDGQINIIVNELNVLRIASGIGCLSW